MDKNYTTESFSDNFPTVLNWGRGQLLPLPPLTTPLAFIIDYCLHIAVGATISCYILYRCRRLCVIIVVRCVTRDPCTTVDMRTRTAGANTTYYITGSGWRCQHQQQQQWQLVRLVSGYYTPTHCRTQPHRTEPFTPSGNM